MNPRDLHPEFGMNPTAVACWFCGQPTGEIALLGRHHPEQAPNRSVLDREPCDRCREDQREGVILLSVSDTSPPEQPERTGRLVVLREAAVHDLFADDFVAQLLEHRVAFVPDALWLTLGLPTEDYAAGANEVDAGSEHAGD